MHALMFQANDWLLICSHLYRAGKFLGFLRIEIWFLIRTNTSCKGHETDIIFDIHLELGRECSYSESSSLSLARFVFHCSDHSLNSNTIFKKL